MKRIIALIVVAMVLAGCAFDNTDTLVRYDDSGRSTVRTPDISFSNIFDLQYFIATNFEYRSDNENFGDDFWQAPQEFLERGTGDCEDFAIFSCYFLEKMNIQAMLVFIRLSNGVYHVVLKIDDIYYQPDSLFPCENQSPDIIYEYSLYQALSVCVDYFGA